MYRRLIGAPRLLLLVRITVTVVGFVILFAIPLYLDDGFLNIGLAVMIGAVGAMGLTMLLGHAGQLSLANGFFMLLGATTYVVISSPATASLVGFSAPPVLAFAAAIAVAALAGMAFAPVAGRVRGIYLGIASLGLIFIGLYLGQHLDNITGGTSNGRPVEPMSIFGFNFSEGSPDLVIADVPFGRIERLWYLFILLVVVAYVVARRVLTSRPGRAWRAVRDSESAAQAMGVNVMRTKAVAFAVSSGFAGAAGAMTVLWLTILKPDQAEYGTFGINASVAVLAAVIIGGTGSLAGAIVGAGVVSGLPLLLTLVMTNGGSAPLAIGAFTPVVIAQYVYGGAVILAMLFEPRGLAGIAARIRYLVSGRFVDSDVQKAPSTTTTLSKEKKE